jgi:hypothetical protein
MMKKIRLALFLFSILFGMLAVIRAQTPVDFEEKFDGTLKDGWIWVRENPKAKRFLQNTLEILMEPFGDNEARNVLLRKAPKRGGSQSYAVELKFRSHKPFSRQYQQAGIFWVQNGQTVFKFVREMIDGQVYVFPGKIPVSGNEITLKVIVNGENVVAEFQTEGETAYRRAYEGKLPAVTDNEQVGIECWHGTHEEENWIQLRRFRIFKHEER